MFTETDTFTNDDNKLLFHAKLSVRVRVYGEEHSSCAANKVGNKSNGGGNKAPYTDIIFCARSLSVKCLSPYLYTRSTSLRREA